MPGWPWKAAGTVAPPLTGPALRALASSVWISLERARLMNWWAASAFVVPAITDMQSIPTMPGKSLGCTSFTAIPCSWRW